jgi:hypothetical protein
MMITHHFGYIKKFLRKPWDSVVVVVVANVVMEKTLEKTLRICEAFYVQAKLIQFAAKPISFSSHFYVINDMGERNNFQLIWVI